MQLKVDVEGSEMKEQRWTASKRRFERLGPTAATARGAPKCEFSPTDARSTGTHAWQRGEAWERAALPMHTPRSQSAVGGQSAFFSIKAWRDAKTPTQQPPTAPTADRRGLPLLDSLDTRSCPPAATMAAECGYLRRRRMRLAGAFQGSAQGQGEEVLGELSVSSKNIDRCGYKDE